MFIRTGDTVEVIAGADKGTQSRVIQVLRADGKALVENVARVYKHVRRSQKHPQGRPAEQGNAGSTVEPGVRLRRVQQGDSAGCPLHRRTASKERFCKKCGAGGRRDRSGEEGSREEVIEYKADAGVETTRLARKCES